MKTNNGIKWDNSGMMGELVNMTKGNRQKDAEKLETCR
jgi:hypothetical protein